MAAYTVTWTIDVEVDGDHKDAAQFVADSYFQARIASGEQDSACSFVVVDETDQHQVDIDLADPKESGSWPSLALSVAVRSRPNVRRAVRPGTPCLPARTVRLCS
ncbi:hypothetical protein [Pseudomonas aeruginosa]|uniref:hypothetical protein n=1 Tax=Pseudomonas aeruginosa TaxID=287 RepID=UPI0030064FD5